MKTPIHLHKERCDLCGGKPECVPACPQQILTIGDHRVLMAHMDRCPDGCTDCISACGSEVFSLVEEVHKDLGVVPSERIEGAAQVHHVAYLRDESEPEKVVRARFERLCDHLALGQRSLGELHAHAWGDLPGGDGVSVQLTWELHSEYYFVRAVLTGSVVGGLAAHLDALVPALHNCGVPPMVTCLDIIVVDSPLEREEVCGLIPSRNRFGAQVLDEELAVYTNYEPVNGRERYVVAGSRAALLEHGGFVVGNICNVENYYHVLMIPRNEERSAIAEVNAMENSLSTRTEAITDQIAEADASLMEGWLKELSVDLARLVRFNSRFNQVLSSTFPYSERVREGFAAWKAQPVAGFNALDTIILERVQTVTEEYRAFLTRLERMEREISDLVAILRTRVEMSMEAQNSAMLANLDQRSAIQLRLQELAEGLSIIVISYYMTGLASYIFKALEKQHIIESSYVWIACFIPIAAATAWYVAHRGVSKIKKETGTGH